MQPKPEHFGIYYAEAFKDQQIVDAYRYRPPYPQEVFSILTSLISSEPRTILDVGAGSGDIGRQLVPHVERVDAVDFSQSMIEKGKRLPHGDDPRLHWIYGKIEEVPLSSPYALITAGSSIHWPDWSIAFPRFQTLLAPTGFLAIIDRRTLPMTWDEELGEIRKQFSLRKGHKGSSAARALTELERQGFFERQGERVTQPVPFQQSIDDFIEGLHSRSGFAKERMGAQQVVDFDQQVRTLLMRFHPDGILPLQVVGLVTWGNPEKGYTK
jgi:SAM-dependent methyltransferase